MLRVHCGVPETRALGRTDPEYAGQVWRVRELDRVSVIIALGKHPVPFRTRKLSLSAPMVLHGGPCGRLGRRRTTTFKAGPHAGAGLEVCPHPNPPTCRRSKPAVRPAASRPGRPEPSTGGARGARP